MKAKEKAVRDAAAALSVAISEARAAGYAIAWPQRPEDLDFIAISETSAVAVEPTTTAAPKPDKAK